LVLLLYSTYVLILFLKISTVAFFVLSKGKGKSRGKSKLELGLIALSYEDQILSCCFLPFPLEEEHVIFTLPIQSNPISVPAESRGLRKKKEDNLALDE
jgi:hypothetical protein